MTFVSSIVYTCVASLNAKYDDFCGFVELYKPPIILLTETGLTSALPDRLVSLENWRWGLYIFFKMSCPIFRSLRYRSKNVVLKPCSLCCLIGMLLLFWAEYIGLLRLQLTTIKF